MTLRGPGKTDITITAEATKDYQTATKDVTITVKPKRVTLKKVTSKKRKTLTAAWKRDPHATGYRIAVSKNRSFKKIDKLVEKKGSKTTKATFTKLSSNKTYYVKARAYKKSRNNKNHAERQKGQENHHLQRHHQSGEISKAF